MLLNIITTKLVKIPNYVCSNFLDYFLPMYELNEHIYLLSLQLNELLLLSDLPMIVTKMQLCKMA